MTAHANQCLQALRRRGQFAEASVFSVENRKKTSGEMARAAEQTKRGTMIAALEVNRRGAKFAVSISLRAT